MISNVANNFFPELDELPVISNDKYGIMNVGLVKNDKVITGYQWNYKYYTGVKVKFFHSYDLRKLRLKVLENGFNWVITDNHRAIESYKFNNELVSKHKTHVREHNCKYRGSSGVLHVSKQVDKRYHKNYTWRYYYEGNLCSNTSLKKLKDKVLEHGWEWIVKDKELYEWNLDNEPFI